ncbi:MAG: hydrolase 2, exosortase A system-associated [Duganella sp.]
MTALPFFLAAPGGQRFCLFHPAPAASRGAILYVHPFAEELNKSRRMAAMQARAYAQAGFQVLQIDLYGCGDSSGDFGDARWQLWHDDLDLAARWLRQRCAGPLYVWGLRLGALLALEGARRLQPDGLILWQPVVSGCAHLHQFARLQSAARLFAAAAPEASGATGASDEIAGYSIAAPLAAAIMAAEAAPWQPACPVHWLELAAPVADRPPALQPASRLVVDGWRQAGAVIEAAAIADTPFWHSTEIVEAPALLAASLAALEHAPGLAA